jgi:hypothetical protein
VDCRRPSLTVTVGCQIPDKANLSECVGNCQPVLTNMSTQSHPSIRNQADEQVRLSKRYPSPQGDPFESRSPRPRLPKVIRVILMVLRVPEECIPDVLPRLGTAASDAGKVPRQL